MKITEKIENDGKLRRKSTTKTKKKKTNKLLTKIQQFKFHTQQM